MLIEDIICDLLYVQVNETTLKKIYCNKTYQKGTICYCTKERHEICLQKEERFLADILNRMAEYSQKEL